MQTVVVYESVWGNTRAIAQAIADGIGGDARALATDQVDAADLAEAELIVAGAPVMGFNLPTDAMRDSISSDGPRGPDLSHPSLRSWLDSLPPGTGQFAAYETRIWWSPRGATGAIEDRLRRAGYRPIAKAHKFVVHGKKGPLREGELDRARQWGRELRRALEAEADSAGPVAS